MKKTLGKVSEIERSEIQQIFNHKNSLEELIIILPPNSVRDIAIDDLERTKHKFQNWWDTMAKKYNWESCENGKWEINFDTCEIYLVDGTCNCKK